MHLELRGSPGQALVSGRARALTPLLRPRRREAGVGGDGSIVEAVAGAAPTLLLLGYPEQCVAAAGQAVSRAQAMGHAYSTALALSHVAFLGTVGCDPERAAAYADEAIALSVEHGLTSPDHRARFCRGALLAQNGDPQRGIELMRNAIALAEGNAERNRRTLYLCHLASAHASLGQPEVSLDLLDEAIQTAEITSERFFEDDLIACGVRRS